MGFSSFSNQLMQGLPQGAFSSSGGMGQKAPVENIPSGFRKFAVQQFNPEQMDLFRQLFQHLGPESYLSKLAVGDENQFDEIEAPALKQFNELQGNLASRFSGMGLGGRHSSGFQNASNAAAQDFAGQLQSNRQGLQRQALMDLMGISEGLLNQRPYDIGIAEKRQKQPSFLQSLGGGVANTAGRFLGGLF